MIKYRLATSYRRQNSYADNKMRALQFDVGDQVYLKISPMKGVMMFSKKGKFSPRYIYPYEVLHHIGNVAYELKLPQDFSSIHQMFQFSMLKKFLGDPASILPVGG